MGCTSAELSPEWWLDRARVLAVQATPAEITAGQTVSFAALTFVPEGEGELYWSTDLTGEFAGPAQEAALAVPEEVLDALPAELLAEGLSLPVELRLETDREVEEAVKYLPVSEASTPNANPHLLGLRAAGGELPREGASLVAEAGAEVELEVRIDPASIQAYEYTTLAGLTEERVEEHEVRWYTSIGSLIGSGESVIWVAPDGPRKGLLYAVLLDGRGGMDWVQLQLAAQTPTEDTGLFPFGGW